MGRGGVEWGGDLYRDERNKNFIGNKNHLHRLVATLNRIKYSIKKKHIYAISFVVVLLGRSIGTHVHMGCYFQVRPIQIQYTRSSF